MFTSNHELMILAAHMYYKEGMTHQAIADKLNTSRITITRILKQAREQEIVRFIFSEPLPERFQLARTIEQTFGLKNVFIVNTENQVETTLENMGEAAAEHLGALIQPGMRIGFSWSGTLSYMAPFLKNLNVITPPCTINDLVGTMLGNSNPYSISGKVADAIQARFEPLPVPAFVSNHQAYAQLMNENQIATNLKNAQYCDVAFLGIGQMTMENMGLKAGYFSGDDLAELTAKGVVGEIGLKFYDQTGKSVHSRLDEHLIGISWDGLSKIPYVVIVGRGADKINAMKGIIKSGVCKCLITDVETACLLMP